MLILCVIEASVYLLLVVPVKFSSYMQLCDAFMVLTEEIVFFCCRGNEDNINMQLRLHHWQ